MSTAQQRFNQLKSLQKPFAMLQNGNLQIPVWNIGQVNDAIDEHMGLVMVSTSEQLEIAMEALKGSSDAHSDICDIEASACTCWQKPKWKAIQMETDKNANPANTSN